MTDHETPYTEGHIVRAFDAEMEKVRAQLLQMGGLVVDQVSRAVHAVCDRDMACVHAVLRRERQVNAYDTDGEKLIFDLLAKRQPMAADLRVVLSYSRAITDLERAGDEACKIAAIAGRLGEQAPGIAGPCCDAVREMGQLACTALKQAVESLDDADEDQALRVARNDATLDAEYLNSLRILQETLAADPELIPMAADLVLVVKALERIGDHAKNIAKYVLYIVLGKDVRHVKSAGLDDSLGDSRSSS